MNYQLSGLSPAGFHLTDLLFHAANAVLAFLLIQTLLLLAAKNAFGPGTVPPGLALLGHGGILVGCSSVSSRVGCMGCRPVPMSSRSSSWSFPFCVTCAFELHPAEKGRGKFYWISILCFAVSLLCYPIGLTLVVVLAVLDLYPLRRFKPGLAGLWDAAACRIWLEKVPYALVSVLVLVATLLPRASNPPEFGPAPAWNSSAHSGAVYAGVLCLGLLRLETLAPFHLSPVYTTLLDFNPNAWPFWLSAAFVIGDHGAAAAPASPMALGAGVVGKPPGAAGSRLGLTERPHFTCDRYDYLPGLVWAVAARRRPPEDDALPELRAVGWPLALALAVFWGGLSLRQTRVWRNSVALFEHMIRELGDDPYRSDIQWRLGSVLASQGKTQEAAQQYQASLRIQPTPEAHLCFR